MQKKTVLIFGVSSFIGSNIAEALSSDYRIVGTYFNSQTINKNFLTIKCDISNPSLVKGIVNLAKPDIVIYCIGEKNMQVCHNSPKRSDTLNANGIFNVINALDAFNAKLFYFSSALIYSGSDKEHDEENSPISNTVYGSSVASAEFYIQKSYLNYIILRLPLVFGREGNLKNSNLLSQIQYSLLKDKAVDVDDSVLYGFLSIAELIKSIKSCIEQNITNQRINLMSSDLMTKYEFAKLICDIFKLNESKLTKIVKKIPLTSNISNIQLRAGKMCFSLSSSKAQQLKIFSPRPIKNMIIEYKDSYTDKKISLKLI